MELRLIFLAILFLSSCKDEIHLPLSDAFWGDIEILKNGGQWNAKPSLFSRNEETEFGGFYELSIVKFFA